MKSKKKETKSKGILKKLASNKGVYITLCAVFAVAGFSMYSNHLRTNMSKRLSDFDADSWQEAVSESEAQVIDIDALTDEGNPSAGNQDSAGKITGFETPPAVVETSAPPAQKTETPKFSMELPCAGTIIADCSIEDLVYCASMNDWRTHNGLDIAGKIGEQVKAAESGVVSQVYKDDLLGVVVVVDHENDISSVYANLQNEDFITVGTEVQKGDIIGGIGECGALEANLEPHLHFEVLSNDEYKNPMDFLNK